MLDENTFHTLIQPGKNSEMRDLNYKANYYPRKKQTHYFTTDKNSKRLPPCEHVEKLQFPCHQLHLLIYMYRGITVNDSSLKGLNAYQTSREAFLSKYPLIQFFIYLYIYMRQPEIAHCIHYFLLLICQQNKNTLINVKF